MGPTPVVANHNVTCRAGTLQMELRLYKACFATLKIDLTV